MDAIYAFVDNFTNIKYKDLPEAAVEAVKKEVIDSLATAIGGTLKSGIPELVDIVKEWGGKGQSTLIGYDTRCPAPDAALVNGTMIHALDYDDGHQDAQVHIGCVAVSSGFAVAERQGKISGKDFITALALGQDFLCRLGLASRPNGSLIKSGWHPTPLYGYLGAASIAGMIMKLDPEKMVNAIGIAYHQCAGNSQAVDDGALTKRLGAGLSSRGGVTSALMAERGITGARNILEGRYGVFNQYHGGDYSAKILTAELGKRFGGADLGMKPYPNCGFTHAYIDAIFSLKKKYDISPAKIKSITAYGGDQGYALCTPPEVKCSPRNPIDSQFSVPWAIALALVKGKITVNDFTPESIKNKEILAVSNKVTGVHEPSMTRHGVGPGRVTILMKDGKEYTEEVEHCLGSVARPMTFDDCAAKFKECNPNSRKPLSAEKVNQIIDMVKHLDESNDATEVIRLLG